MPTIYQVQPICSPDDNRLETLEDTLRAELHRHGLQGVIKIDFVETVSDEFPNVVLFFGGDATLTNESYIKSAHGALDTGKLVIPIVNIEEGVEMVLPDFMQSLNALCWDGRDVTRIARVILEELGIEERQRKVFISHKRQDGLLMAEQLHDGLSHRHF